MILATRDGDREMRSVNLSQLGVGPLSRRVAGVTVNPVTVSGIPAFTRAVRIAAEAVASLQMRVWRGFGLERVPVDNVWQARLLRGALSDRQTRFQFWETIEESLSKRGNAYIWKNTDPSTGRVTEMVALHPDQVNLMYLGPNPGLEYQVVVAPGYIDPVGKGMGFYRVDSDTILHIRGHGDGGALVAPSPISTYRDALGVGVAKLKYESRLYDKGTALRLSVEFPQSMTATQAREWRELWRESYELGADGGSTAVTGGGGVIKPIGITMADAQFIESQNFGVAEAARIIGVPASLLDSGEHASTSTPKLPEWEQTRWLRYGLGPRLERIESAFSGDAVLFAPHSPVQPGFDTEKFIRGDLTTEASIALAKVQSGQWTPDEARMLDGLPPLPGGVGAVPIITPVGAAPNPDPVPTSVPAGEE